MDTATVLIARIRSDQFDQKERIFERTNSAMKIFISWSGERSQAVASALRDWFPLVLHYVTPWLSKSDIQAGERWSVEIAKELEACNFGIICITKENLNAPWILFEAGALAKSMEHGRVIPLLLDVDFKEVTGPLAQFQASKVDASSMKELVLSLNKVATSPIAEQPIDRLFNALWPDLEKQLAAIPKSTAPVRHSRPQGEILEELVSGVRNLEMRVRDIGDEEGFFKRRRRRLRVHPELMVELAHRLSYGSRDPVQVLVLTSLVKNELPWLYELALDAFRSNRFGHKAPGRPRKKFLDALEILDSGPFLEEMGVDPYLWHYIRRELRAAVRPSEQIRPSRVAETAPPTSSPDDTMGTET